MKRRTYITLIFLLVSFRALAFEAPTKLSDWKLFSKSSKGHFELGSEAIFYNLNTPLFSDYAKKFRALIVPKGKKIKVVKKRFVFPEGTVIAKTFFYDKASVNKLDSKGITGPWGEDKFVIETRILFKTPTGWLALPYIWDLEKEEALLSNFGKRIDMEYVQEGEAIPFNYFVPNKNQCQSCHIVYKGFDRFFLPLGPSEPRNMKRKIEIDGKLIDQIAYFKSKGLLEENLNLAKFEAFPIWKSAHSNLKKSAKAYLHVNCAHCHNRNGPAGNTGLYLNFEQKNRRKSGICKSPVAPGSGSGGHPFAINPGKPDKSILVFRMKSRKLEIMMPELGRDLQHKEGVEMVSNWIKGIKDTCK